MITLTVPLAIAGGLLGLAIAGMSFEPLQPGRAYFVGGPGGQNGILIVEFANQGRDEGFIH